MDKDEIVMQRKNKFLSIGRNKGFTSKTNDLDNLSMKQSLLDKLKNKIKADKKILLIPLLIILGVLILYQL